jgi:hypothetical protein
VDVQPGHDQHHDDQRDDGRGDGKESGEGHRGLADQDPQGDELDADVDEPEDDGRLD